MTQRVKNSLAVVTASVLLGGLLFVIRANQSKAQEKQEGAEANEKHKSEGVRLDRETQERIGLQVQALRSATIRPDIAVYGTLEADPSEEFVLRAPFTGILETPGEWPPVGSRISAEAPVGNVKPLFSPLDQIGLSERLASSHAELEAAETAVATASKEVSRLKQLNAENQNVSDKAVQDAETQLAGEQAKLKSAQASVDLITGTLRAGSHSDSGLLRVSKGGQVTEVAAQPGESVQAGQALLRINRFDHLLARLYVPPGENIPASADNATIYPADQAQLAIPAHRVALAGAVDPKYQGQMWLFRLANSKLALRPGQAVTAHIAIPGPVISGVTIPSPAILRFQGETWVYVEKEGGVFVRRMLALDQPGQNGWIVKSNFVPGERIVVSGAQTLLSEELKSQLESDEE